MSAIALIRHVRNLRAHHLGIHLQHHRHHIVRATVVTGPEAHRRAMTGTTAVDVIIDAGWVIPVAPDETRCLTNTSIVIRGADIVDLVPTEIVAEKYTAKTRLSRPSSVAMPGMVNAHTHSPMTLMRGRGDDQTLLDWLRTTVWPIEAEFASNPEFCYDGCLLAVAEMLRGGVTTFADMYFHPAAAANAVVRSGMRAILGIAVIAFPTKYASTIDEYLENGHAARAEFSHESRITWAYAPHAPYTVPTSLWQRLRLLAEENDCKIHTHLHETTDECSASAALDRSNPACHLSDRPCTPFADLDHMGLANDRLVAAHMVHLTDEEIDRCASRRVNVVNCPTSNAKLASGYCRVDKLLKAGVNVAIGTDSACSNNSLDLRAEMKLTALSAKNLSGDASFLPAATAIKMATLNGAEAFGLADTIGSLEIGKRADIICIDVNTHAGNSPMFNAHSAVVYASAREDVRDVLVDGKFLLCDGEYKTIEIKQVLERSDYWRRQIDEKFPMSRK